MSTLCSRILVKHKELDMPRVSEFYGIAVYMYYKEHAPPHFHVIYTQYDTEIGIDPVRLIEGSLPRRVQSMIF